jgi:hypothetical protein
LAESSRASVKAASVTVGFCPSVISFFRKSGMPPGWARSNDSPVASFLNVILSPEWMYEIASRCSLISSASNFVVLKIDSSGSK